MRLTLRRAGALSWTSRAVVAAVLVSGSAAATAGIAASAQAQVRTASASSSATVVNEAKRTGFGKILVTPKVGMSLYYMPTGSCNSGCQSVWPPLLMPKGKTKPLGSICLGTAKLGSRLQVTFKHRRLYTFTGDSGHSVNGNGLAGFVVAKVVTKCPA
jgi:predicted lipoprotein with Yx(FWY)xxD motif